MRTFKRPMFRKGGNVGNGIMTGIVDRTEAAEGFTGEEMNVPKYSRQLTELQASTPINTSMIPFEPTVYENIDIDKMVGTPKSQAEYIEEIRAGAGDYGGMDPLTSFLLTAGPSVAGATSFSDAVKRLQPATQQLIKGADAKAKYNRDIRMAGTKLALAAADKSKDKRFNLELMDLEGENKVKFLNDERKYEQLSTENKRNYDEAVRTQANAIAKLSEEDQKKFKRQLLEEGNAHQLMLLNKELDARAELSESELKAKEKAQDKDIQARKDLLKQEQDAAKLYTERDYIEVYNGDTVQANNRAKFENEKLKIKALEKFGSQYEGFLNGPNDPQQDKMEKKGNNKKIGKVYYDVDEGIFKIYNKKTDGTYGFEKILDINTYTKPEAPKGSTQKEKDAEIDKRFEVLSPNQKRIIEEIQNMPPDPFPGA